MTAGNGNAVNGSRLIVVASAIAYVDPSVQVHDSKCSHGMMKWYSDDWSAAGPFDTLDKAERAATRERRRIGAADIAWCDCALLSSVAWRTVGIVS